MRRILYILVLIIGFSASAQVTIIVESVPKETPNKASIFISGNFEGWSGGQKDYQLQQKDEVYTITLPKMSESIQFKFTQGSWESVECSKKGLSIENHTYTFKQPNDTLKVEIAGWTNLFDLEKVSTAAKNVSVLSEEFEIPQLNRKRRIWLYLPPNYDTSNESYPVVYMHDGQNLFDNSMSFSGEWNVDETLNRLYSEKHLKVIVVGIDNGGDKRLDEYSPWKNQKYGCGEGEAYTKFIVETLKPYIDANYKTLKDKSNTAIIGSSMGGLIAHYAGLQYPNVFGKVGVYSPAFWFSPKVNEFSKTHGNLTDTKMYFLAGGKEGANVSFEEISQTVLDMNAVIEILKNQGFNTENIQSKVVPEGKHNEELWRTNFEETMLWLFSNNITERRFVDTTWNNNQLQVHVSDGTYNIQFYTSEIIETTFLPTGETAPSSSHAIIAKPTISDIELTESAQYINLMSSGIDVIISKEPFNISYTYKGKPVISEKAGYVKNDSLETIQFNLTKDEVLYGGGARALGMNRRGNRLQLYNKAHYGYETTSELMNFTLPIVMSSNKYMVHFDNAPIGFLDLDSKGDNTLTYETISGRKTYQIIVGESWYDIVDNYTILTGKQPILPRWALGNFSSRFGYHSQEEVEMTIDTFNEEKIPVDAIILDLYWFGKELKGTMGNLEVFRDSFPDFEGMVARLYDKGVKTITITEPFILTTSNKWDEAVEKKVLATDSIGNPAIYDFYFGNTGIVDIYKPEGEQWFKNIYKGISEMGIRGFWGDLGEPEVLPSWVNFSKGTADEIHNIYGHDWAKLVQEASLEAHPNQRPFILMRAGYSGSQRYGLVPWSGDVSRSWGGLQSQPAIALQMGMQGLAYMHSDLGGFAGANLDDELYTRWLQYGVFQPIFRPHAQEDVASEPVFRSDKAKALAKEAIELRYKLLPYNYNLMFENNQTGAPLMRPLFFEEADNLNLLTYSDAYLWGNDFLVAPILEAGQLTKDVYFPKSSNWFDFYSDEKFKGGQTTTVQTKENSIPTFVRGGSFIPIAKPMQSTSEYHSDHLVIHYYYDNSMTNSESHFYDDDGILPNAFQKANYEFYKLSSIKKGRILNISSMSIYGVPYVSKQTDFTMKIHAIDKPKYVKVNGKKIEFLWEKESKLLEFDFDKNSEIKIKLIK